MFKLAECRAAKGGVYCGEDGVWLGPAALIEPSGAGGYQIRSGDQIETLLRAAYAEPPDLEDCVAGLRRVAAYLAEGNLPLAMIAAVRLRLGAIAQDRVERLARADDLLKANFNPDETRDDRGRWSDDVAGDFILDDPTAAGGTGAAVPRAWQHYPNADFRNRLAIAENTADDKDFGYSTVLDHTDNEGHRHIALGRYQLTPVALRAAGMMDSAGRWTGKYGVHSRAGLLADAEAQEKALTDYLNDNIRQLRAYGAFDHIGQTIDGLKARFPVTLAGIIAAAHREGAPATADYLKRVQAHGLSSKGLRLKPFDRPIETRLRTFSGASL